MEVLALVTLLIVVLFFAIRNGVKNDAAKFNENIKTFEDTGYQFHDKWIDGRWRQHPSLLIDRNKNAILFAWLNKSKMYDFRDVNSYSWDWINDNGKKTQNFISFYLNDVDTPLIKVQITSANLAEEIFARLQIYLGLDRARAK
jgi:hypothetical protein